MVRKHSERRAKRDAGNRALRDYASMALQPVDSETDPTPNSVSGRPTARSTLKKTGAGVLPVVER